MNRLLLVAFGSNVGEREKQVASAIQTVGAEVGKLLAVSRLYESEPFGVDHTQPYINAVAAYSTELMPEVVHQFLQEIETQMGRLSKGDLRPRTIDLDLIALGTERCSTSDLTIPHPRMEQRKFVLHPLADVVPTWQHPGTKRSVSELLLACRDNGWIRPVSWK